MLIALYVLFVIAFYLFGSIPFMLFLGKINGYDLSNERDLHHTLWYKVGRRWAITGVLLDVLKGALPVWLGLTLNLPILVTVLGALAGLTGQMWPVFRKFNGERGNTVGLGIIPTLTIMTGTPLVLIIAISLAALGFIIRAITRWQQSGSNLKERLKFRGSPSLSLPLFVILGFASCPITSWLIGQSWEFIFGYLVMLLLILIRRVTADLFADIRTSSKPCSVIINRLLYDRSEI